MPRSTRAAVSLMALTVLAACTERAPNPPTQPSRAPSAAIVPDNAALEAKIETLIGELYAPRDQGVVHAAFAQIKAAIGAGQTAAATSGIVAFFGARLADLKSGILQDPNGANPPSTADALRDLLNNVAQFGGLAPPIPVSNPLSGDGAVAVVGPAGGTVVTSHGFAGVRFPAGALPSDVILVIARLPNPASFGNGPLPTDFDQYPLFYDYSTTPTVSPFLQPVTVSLCRMEVGDSFGPVTQAIADRLQDAHPDPADPTNIEILPKVDGSFIHCTGVSLASLEPKPQAGRLAAAVDSLMSGGSRLASYFMPTPAYAVHSGLGGLTDSFSPFAIVDPGRLHFASVAAGERHTCALTVRGQAWCWGENVAGGLGDGTTTNRLAPTQTVTTVRFTKLSANNQFTCGLGTDARAYCWGRNYAGQLGTGDTTTQTTPAAVAGNLSFVDIGTGEASACGLTSAGEAWCWGSNQFDQLGGGASPQTCRTLAGTFACSTTPVRAAGSMTFTKFDVGFWNVCGLVSNGQSWCWGNGELLPFGSGVASNVVTATPLLGANGMVFSSIYQSAVEGCGLDATGKAWCWGINVFGGVGDGTTTVRSSPVPVAGNLTFSGLALKDANNTDATACGITSGGDAYCWGSDIAQELGAPAPNVCQPSPNNSGPCGLQPVHLSGPQLYVQISIGDSHACGVTTTQAVYCWGTNTSGQLGNGTTNPSAAPTPTLRSF